MDHEDTNLDQLLEKAQQGDKQALNALFSIQRDQLRTMVNARMNRKVRSRLDASDVIQNAQVEMVPRLHKYLENPTLPFPVWLRLEVGRQLILAHRQHLKTQKREAHREVSMGEGIHEDDRYKASPEQEPATLSTPSRIVGREEEESKLREALEALPPVDRDIILLRHFQLLSRKETAQELGLSESTVAKRHVRTLLKLRKTLGDDAVTELISL